MDYTAMSAQPLRRQTLVLVTDQFQCERIIKAGRAIAGITHTQLRVFHICAEGRTSDPAALQYLYNSAKENGSVLEIAYNSDFTQFDILHDIMKVYNETLRIYT